jgi:protease-4
MSINNLHSLLNGRWFVEETYGRSLLPSLHGILKGNSFKVKEEDRKPDSFITGRKASMVSASSFDSGDNHNDYVLVISLKDPIYKYSQDCGPQGTKSKMAVMERYRNDSFCKGVVLDIDSGGGQVSGTPEFYDYILNYGKPVVSYTDGYMCSAAYYIGSSASHIIANKRAEHIGSIGTMVHFIDFSGWYEQLGAKVITEYATKSVDKNRDFEELLQGNPEGYIKNQLDPITDDFISDIKSVRSKVSEKVFTGKTFNAKESLKMGLIDEIGSMQTAIDKVFELASESSKPNKDQNMSKQREKLQSVLALDAPLASTENGSYLNEEQLDAIETHLGVLEGNNATLSGQVEEVRTGLQNELNASNSSLTAAENEVDAMMTTAGLTPAGSLTEKLASLSAKVAEMGKGDGASHTNVKTDVSDSTADVLGISDELENF